jgi:hypothetical protein
MAFTRQSNTWVTQSKTANMSSFSVISNTQTLPAGYLAVLLVAVDNSQTTDGDEGAVSSVTDTHGNTWLKAAEHTNGQGGSQAGATCSVWYSLLGTTLAANGTDAVTVNFTNNTARDAAALVINTWTIGSGNVVEVEATGTLSADGAAPGNLNPTTANIECLRVRAIATESNSTTNLTVTNVNWTTFAVASGAVTSGGGSASNMGIRGESTISTGTGSSSNPTLFNADHASVYVAFKEVAAPAPPATRAFTLLGVG